MSKKRLIIAAILIVIGIIGAIPSSFFAAPYVMNLVQDGLKDSRYNEQVQGTILEPITKINVRGQGMNVEINKSDTKDVVIKAVSSDYEMAKVSHTLEKDILNINVEKEYATSFDFMEAGSFKELFENGVKELSQGYRSAKVIIEVPEKVNIEMIVDNGDLTISDTALLLGDVSYKVNNGNFKIKSISDNTPLKSLHVEKQSVEFYGETKELSLFEKVTIQAPYINIEETGARGNEVYTKELSLTMDGGNIAIKQPFFQALTIKGIGEGYSVIHVDIPLEEWNPMLDVKSSNSSIEIGDVSRAKSFNDYPYPNKEKGQMTIHADVLGYMEIN